MITEFYAVKRGDEYLMDPIHHNQWTSNKYLARQWLNLATAFKAAERLRAKVVTLEIIETGEFQ